MGVNLKEQMDKAQGNVRRAKETAEVANAKVDAKVDSVFAQVLSSKYTAVVAVVLVVGALVLGIYLGKHG